MWAHCDDSKQTLVDYCCKTLDFWCGRVSGFS